MTFRTLHPALLGCLLLCSPAFAFEGDYELTGKYSNRRATAVDVTVRKTGNEFTITRTGRYTSRRHRSKPAFTWAARAIPSGDTLRVLYVVKESGGLAGALTGATNVTNNFVGTYTFSSDRKSISEKVVNVTRRGSHRWWRHVETSGDLVVPATPDLLTKAKDQTRSLRDMAMDFFANVADYFGPGDHDVYDRTSRELLRDLRNASWNEVAPPAGFSAFKTFSPDLDYDGEGGAFYVLMNANGTVKRLLMTHFDSWYDETGNEGDLSPTSTTPALPPGVFPPLACAAPASDAEIMAKADDADSRLVSFIMSFRSNIADYYDPGDQDHYDDDTQSAETYFATATYSFRPIPAGYQGYKAVRITNNDPDGILLGHIVLVFDCDGDIKHIVYFNEGSTYDENDV